MNGTCLVSHNTNYTIRDKMVSQEDKNEAWMSRPYKKYSNSSNDNLSTDSNLDEEDDDSQVIRLNPIRPCLRWKDSSFQSQTMEALNQMRKNRHFCDVTLQVSTIRIKIIGHNLDLNHFKIDYGIIVNLFLRLNLISSCSRFNRATSK